LLDDWTVRRSVVHEFENSASKEFGNDLREIFPNNKSADDHTLVAEACQETPESDYEIVATVGDGRSIVIAAAELRPTLLL